MIIVSPNATKVSHTHDLSMSEIRIVHHLPVRALVRREVDGGDWGCRRLGCVHTAKLLRENLLYAMTQAGFRAGFHFRLFDDLLPAVLHPDTHRSTLIFVESLTHAQTAPAARFVLRRPCGGGCHAQHGENEHCGHEFAFHSDIRSGREPASGYTERATLMQIVKRDKVRCQMTRVMR